MRFLLHPISKKVAAVTNRSARKLQPIAPSVSREEQTGDEQPLLPTFDESTTATTTISGSKSSAFESTTPSTSPSSSPLLMRAWGQQCSLTCGCVLRFELQMDLATQRILSTHYVAHTIVTQRDAANGRLVPAFITTTTTTMGGDGGRRRPWLQPCSCIALHTLAKHVVTTLPGQTWNWLYNMMDFSGIRSSPALVHAVLSAHEGLSPQEHSHCFDLVEEACTAMVKRYLPKPRDYYRDMATTTTMNDATTMLLTRTNASSTLPSSSSLSSSFVPTVPRAMSTLRMYDIQAEGAPLDYRTYQLPYYGQPPPPNYDWLDHVDHLKEVYDDDAEEDDEHHHHHP